MHVYLFCLPEAFCHFPVSSFVAQMGWCTFLTPWSLKSSSVCRGQHALVSSAGGLGREDSSQFLPRFLMLGGLPFHEAGQSALLLNVLFSSDWQTSNTHKLLFGCAATLPSEGPLQLCHPAMAKPKWLHWKRNFLEAFPQRLFWQIFLLHSQNGKSYKCHNCLRDTVCTLVLWNRCTILL